MAYQKISYELDGAVAVVLLNDPATLNAIDAVMVDELTIAFGRASSEARCVVLTGAGRAFCSGANLAAGGETGEDGRIDAGLPLERRYNGFVTLLRDLPIPFITAVNGLAAGAGASFALMGDLILAAESAYFLQAFRRIGLVPDAGATYLLPRMTSRVRAMELMLLGEKLPAAKALEWGLVNRCLPEGELMGEARTLAHELANGPTRALGLIRQLAWRSLESDWRGQLQAEREAQREAGYSQDFIEGVQAFFAKRPAQFRGG